LLRFSFTIFFARLKNFPYLCGKIIYKNIKVMDNHEYSEIRKQRNELLRLILKKTGVSYRSLLEHAKTDFIINNLDVVTAAEQKQFSKLVFQ
jgi:hypothetical protein